MSEIEGIEGLATTVAEIEIEGPLSNGNAQLPPDISTAVADARRDLPAHEPLTEDEIAARTAAAEEAARQADPLYGKTLVDDGEDVRVVEPDELERAIADGMGDGIDSVTITGPGGTRGAEAIRTVIENTHLGDDNSALFDRSEYVAVPEIDGQAVDKLVVSFSGSVAYDAEDEEGKALFESLTLGKAVELRVAGFVAQKTGTYKVTARDEEVVTGKATLKVDTLYLLRPEQLA